MATKRRTLRVARNTVKYANDSSSDEEGDDPSVKRAKLKLKQMVEEDSDGVDPDFEKPIEPESKMEESESSSDSSPEQNNDVKERLSKFESDKNKSLNLSESDSSDDEDIVKKVINTHLVKSNGIKSSVNTFNYADDMNNDADEDASQKLLALVGNLDQINNAWKENDSQPSSSTFKRDKIPPKSSVKSKSKSKKLELKSVKKEPTSMFDLSISKLLAEGEGVEGDVDSSEEEEEEVKKEAVFPKEGVQVTIQLPNHIKKKKRKGFDVQAFLKREMSRARRELQILLHKSHFVCLVTHLQHLHHVVSNPLLQATALSLVPSVHIHSVQQLTLTRLSSLLSWIREAVPVNKYECPSVAPKTSVTSSLKRGLETLLAMNDTELVLMFILICRAMNYETRIVLNFPILPLKPPTQESPPLPIALKESKPKHDSDVKYEEKDNKSHKTPEKNAKDIKSSSKDNNKTNTSSHSKKSSSKELDKKGKVSKSKIRHPVSDEEGTDSPPPPVKLSSKQKKTSISSKLADAVSKRAAKASLVSGCSKDTEEDIIKRINKKYPTNEKDKKGSSPSTKLSDAVNKKRPSKSKAEDIMKGMDDKYSSNIKKEESPIRSKEEKSPKSSSSQKGKGKSKGNNSKAQVECRDYWCEIWLSKESKWVAVDLLTGRINAPTEFEGKASKPMTYVLAVNNDGSLKDVTQRYASSFLTSTRKLRIDESWFDEIMKRYLPTNREQARKEDLALSKQADDIPLPTSVTAFKGHPLYVLQRHLLKFEAIYPATAPTLGFIKGEAVYARECVHTLQGRTSWLKEGRVVRIGEEPYKVVKARPKWDRMTGSKVADAPLEVFGHWQTELYIPPPAKDGMVPRNEYGNVELFKPWMLPAGTVHIPINGMSRVIKKSGIDAAPAMVGWDFSGGGVHPVYDGYVVCKENAEALMDAWNHEQHAKEERDREKREKRVLDNWKKLVKGLMFREKLQSKYLKNV